MNGDFIRLFRRGRRHGTNRVAIVERIAGFVVLFLVVFMQPGVSIAASEVPGVLVWDIDGGSALTVPEAATITNLVKSGIARSTGRPVAETGGLAVECHDYDFECAISAAKSKGADSVISGSVARLGNALVLNLRFVTAKNVRDGKGWAMASRSFESLETLAAGIPALIRELLTNPGSGKGVVDNREPVSLTRQRITVMPTAVGLERGDFNVTGYGLGLWEIQYGVHRNVQIGALTMLPVGLAAFVPTVSGNFRPHENIALAVGGYFGVFGSFADMGFIDEAVSLVYGGSVRMSAVFDRHILNLGFIVGSAAGKLRWAMLDSGGEVSSVDNLNGAYMMPSIGYRAEVHRNWSIQIELAIPLYASPSGSVDRENVTPLLFYGVRGHGGLVFGDFGFMIPCHQNYFDSLWKYTPLGFPYFSLGFAF